MKILALNQYNSDNIGDMLIGKVLSDRLSSNGFETVLGGFAQMNPQQIVHSEKKMDIFTWLKKKCPSILKYHLQYKRKIVFEASRVSIQEMDAIIIGGGQLIKHGGVFPYCFKDWSTLASKYCIPLYIYGVGVDNNLDPHDISLYRDGLKYANKICCRDKQSAKSIKEYFSLDAEVWPDIVFSLGKINSSTYKKDLIIMPYSYETAHSHFKTVKSREDYYLQLEKAIDIEEYDKLILSATTSADLNECYRFGKHLDSQGISYSIVTNQSEKEMIEMIKTAKTVYSGRMHALILCLLCGINTIPIEISNKISDFSNNYLKGKDGCEEAIVQSRMGLFYLCSQMRNEG